MFGKLFSRSSLKNEPQVKQTVNPTDTVSVIEEAIISFTSSIFPKGLAEAVLEQKITQHNSDIIVELTLPFPCAGELQTLADQLTASLSTPITFRVHSVVKKIKNH